jgi:hypothetical protein
VRVARTVGTALAVAALVWLMLDSGLVTPERAPAMTSASLGGLGLLFALGGWAMHVGGQPERTPLLAGIGLGLLGYALVRVVAL